jgi:tetratricopeptide (TPR) repeat protein
MSSSHVRAFEKTLTIPTYPPGPGQRTPLFNEEGYMRIFPYPKRDHITFQRKKVQYRALVLENRFLRLMVLPELGGHLWSLYDKLRNREVFYRPNAIKPGLIALSGAWVPVGIEFNFPNGHHPMSLSPVAGTIGENPDGSASIAVGDTEFLSRMRWHVRMTLRPGVAALDIETRLSNPTPLEQSWYFWANAAVEATDGWVFCCPARFIRRPWENVKWNYPVHEGRDLSRYRDRMDPADTFAAGVEEDFFGCYNEDNGAGIVHVADWHDCFGKKFFTWGAAPGGKSWGAVFNDRPIRHYVEIQAGPLETQADREWFPGRGERIWHERWYPIDRTGPFFHATREVAIGFSGEGRGRKLNLYACQHLGDVCLEITIGGGRTRRRGVCLKPGSLVSMPLPEGIGRSIRLVNAPGRELLKIGLPYRPKVERGLDARLETLRRRQRQWRAPRNHRDRIQAARECAVRGLWKEALKFLNQALEMAPGNGQARLLRGRLELRAGRWAMAHKDLAVAAKARSRATRGEAHYLMGVLAQYRRKHARAARQFESAGDMFEPDGTEWARCQHALAEVEIALGRLDAAERRLTMLGVREHHATAERLTLWALVLRLQGERQRAASTVDAVLKGDPVNLAARWERCFATGGVAGRGAAEHAREIRAMHLAPSHPAADRVLELAWTYERLGLCDEALEILGASNRKDPRLAYLAAFLHHKRPGSTRSDVDRAFKRARESEADHSFPFRIEEIELFDWVTEVRPGDGKAFRLRGTVLGGLGRYTEALADFEKAVDLDQKDALAWRNAGIAKWELGRSLKRVTACFEKACALDSGDPDLACELLSMYERIGLTEERLRIVDSAPPSVRNDHRFRKRILGVLAESERYRDVVRMTERFPFVPWEGEISVHAVFQFCCLQLCRLAINARRFAEARGWADRAGTYPENVFSKRPSRPVDATWRYWKALVLEAMGKERQALAQYRRAADEKDYRLWHWVSTEAPVWRAQARRRLGRDAEARADFEKVIELAPRRELFYGKSSVFADYAAALSQLGLGRRERAVEELKTVLRMGGHRYRVRLWLEKLKTGNRRNGPFLWPHERLVEGKVL